MKIEKTVHGTHAALALKGNFETDAAVTFLQTIDELRADGVTRVTANLRLVKYLNSTALGTMIKVGQTLSDEDGGFVIVRPSPVSREIISKMGLDRVVPMFDDEDAAVEYLVAGGSADRAEAVSAGPVEERLGPTVVVFSFGDERAEMFKGRSRFGIGTIESVDPRGVVFVWDPNRHDMPREDTEVMFAKGKSIRTKFQIKLIRKDHFHIDGEIDAFGTNRDGTVIVSARWTRLKGPDQSDLEQFTNDMDYLKRQLPRESAAE